MGERGTGPLGLWPTPGAMGGDTPGKMHGQLLRWESERRWEDITGREMTYIVYTKGFSCTAVLNFDS